MLAGLIIMLQALAANPSITVTVRGEVAVPQRCTLADGSCLLQAIAAAGGIRESTANLSRVTLSRRGSTEVVPIDLGRLLRRGELGQNYRLEDGDTIVVPGAADRVVWFRTPQAVYSLQFQVGLTLGEGLRRAGWSPGGDEDTISVERRTSSSGEPAVAATFKASRMMSGPNAGVGFELEAGDVVRMSGGALRPREPERPGATGG